VQALTFFSRTHGSAASIVRALGEPAIGGQLERVVGLLSSGYATEQAKLNLCTPETPCSPDKTWSLRRLYHAEKSPGSRAKPWRLGQFCQGISLLSMNSQQKPEARKHT
jgi:hypothetical protein